MPTKSVAILFRDTFKAPGNGMSLLLVLSPEVLCGRRVGAVGMALCVRAWVRASMTGALAAVDVQNLSGDERGEFQEHDAADDVIDFAHASERVQCGQWQVRLR